MCCSANLQDSLEYICDCEFRAKACGILTEGEWVNLSGMVKLWEASIPEGQADQGRKGWLVPAHDAKVEVQIPSFADKMLLIEDKKFSGRSDRVRLIPNVCFPSDLTTWRRLKTRASWEMQAF